MRRKNDALENIMRQGVNRGQRGNQDDVVIHSVEYNGQELSVAEIRRELEFDPSPDGEGMVPKVVSKIKYRLDDQGRSFRKVGNVGTCRFGCWVRADRLYICRHCHKPVCPEHALLAAQRIYCRKRPCSVYGRLRQLRLGSMRMLRFCLKPFIDNKKTASKDREVVSEKEFFATPKEEEVDLNVAERGTDNGLGLS